MKKKTKITKIVKVIKITKAQIKKKIKRLENKAYKLWALYIKLRAGNKCETCPGTKYLNSHHIESYSVFKQLRYDVHNGACACAGCHKYFKTGAWHKGFTFAYNHMTTKRKEDLDYLLTYQFTHSEAEANQPLTEEELVATIKELERLIEELNHDT